MDQSARYPRNKKTIINLEFDSMLQRLLAFAKHVIQSFSLSNCTRESIKDETVKRQGGKSVASVSLDHGPKKMTVKRTPSYTPCSTPTRS